MPAPIDVIVHLDPGCPWAWTTSRWLHAVADVRPIRPHWHSLSLFERDGDRIADGAPPHIREMAREGARHSHRLLRVFEALRAAGREPDIDHLYTQWGTTVLGTWPPPPISTDTVAAILTDAGLAGWTPALDDPGWDRAIVESLDAARHAAGREPTSPTIQIAGTYGAFTGPLFTPGTGPIDAGATWDALNALAADPGFVELSRASGRVDAALRGD